MSWAPYILAPLVVTFLWASSGANKTLQNVIDSSFTALLISSITSILVAMLQTLPTAPTASNQLWIGFACVVGLVALNVLRAWVEVKRK
jgi:hypothetical protein